MRWLGDRSRLPFSVLFSLRSHFVRSPGLVVLSVTAIALSVSLATSLEIATRGVQAELERTASALAGEAELEVSGGDLGIREGVLERVTRIPGVLAAAPLLLTTLSIAEGPLVGYPLRVLGVDFLSDRKVRDYSISEGGLKVSDPLRLMSDPGAIIITKRLAVRLELSEGDDLLVRVDDQPRTLTIRGLLLPGGVADAYGGHVVAMDIYALQELLNRRGWFDQIDVALEESAQSETVLAAIRRELSGVATVRRAALRGEQTESAFGAIGLAVWIFACIGVVLAGFLSYGAMSLSVDWRADEFALLQLAGLEPAKLRWLVRVDGLLVALLGTAIGIGGGIAIAGPFFSALAGFMSQLERIEPQQPEASGTTLLVGLAVGLVVSIVATLEPAQRATSRPALLVLREAQRQPRSPEWTARRGAALALALGGLVAGASSATGLPAIARLGLVYGASLVLGVGLLGPLFRMGLGLLSPMVDRAVPGLGVLIGSGLLARPNHTALTVAGLAVASAGLVATLIVVGSSVRSVSDWISSRSPGGFLITAGDPFSSDTRELELLSRSSIAAIRAIDPNVPLSETYIANFLHRGREVVMITRSYGVMADYGRVPAIGRDPAIVARALNAGDVAVSEAFARSFGAAPGDLVALDTPAGRREFRVASLVRDFSAGPSGAVLMDVDVFERYWQRAGASGVVVWPRFPEDYERRVRGSLGGQRTVFFTSSDEYAQYAMHMFNRFSGLVYGVIGLTSVLGAAAVMNLVFGGVVERRGEISLLRTSGATRTQILGLVLADALIVGAFGSGAGLLLGLLSSDQMFSILTESLGWTVDRRVDWGTLGAIGLSVTAISVVGSLLPAMVAARVPAIGLVRR